MTTLELVETEVDARAAEVERQVAQARAQAEAIQVRNAAEADAAGELLREISRRRKAAEAERKELTGPLDEAKRRIMGKFKDAMAPFDEIDPIVRDKVAAYQAEQDRIRREEEARLEEERQERERKAREAREKQEAEQRAAREQAEREAREAAEEARKAKDAADREAAEALAAEARQKAQEAQTAEAAIASLPEVSLPKAAVEAPAPVSGVTTTKRWDFEVTDLAAVPAALPDGEPLIEVRSGAARRYMHAYLKEHGVPPEIPGFEFKQVTGTAVRS